MNDTGEAVLNSARDAEEHRTSAPPEVPRGVPKSAPKRRGDVSKCPICGSGIDPEAFHCAQCHNYFCYHCRARLLKSDRQLQCTDQNCDYYAKLMCSECDEPGIRQDPPVEFVEPLDGYWPLWLVASLIVGGLTWYYGANFAAGAWTALALFILGGFLIHRAGINIFGGERRIVEERTTTYYSCLRCKQPVKEIPSL
jgi:hypothetical protein